MQRTLGKFTPPKVGRVLVRRRLLAALDAASGRPIIWIDAPAGSGKTILAASYVAAKRCVPLWYSVDAGDSDPASFLHHLAEAARRAYPSRRMRLPRLAADLLPDVAVFTRHFARRMFERIPPRTFLVMDNYQQLLPESPVHALIALIMEEAPDGFHLMALSREPPPAAFARLCAHERIARLGWNDVRFTSAEARAFMSLRGMAGVGRRTDEVIEKTQGWVAGLILLGESTRWENYDRGHGAQAETFDYFAAEVLREAPAPLCEFLLKSALAPEITVPIAKALTGHPYPAQILADLMRRNYFTVQHPERHAVYAYHPLFREFLCRTAEHRFGKEACAQLRARAARALEEAGDLERAAEYYAQVEDWRSLLSILHIVAPPILAGGRNRLLLAWLQDAPERASDALPWLRYWHGLARLMLEPHRGLAELEGAYASFLSGKDELGCCLAWSSIVEALYFLHLFDRLPHWMEERKRFALPGDAPLAVRAGYVASVYTALLGSSPGDPEIDLWREQALRLIESNLHPDARLRLGQTVLMQAVWAGCGHADERVLLQLGPIAGSRDVSPLAAFMWHWYASQHHFFRSTQPDNRALSACTDALSAIAQEHGITAMGHLVHVNRLELALDRGDLHAAEEAVKQFALVRTSLSANDRCFLAFLTAWYCRTVEDHRATRELAEEAVRIANSVPMQVARLYTGFMLGVAHSDGGGIREALRLLAASRRDARSSRIAVVECLSLFFVALICLDRNRPARALRALRVGLAIAAREGYMHLPCITREEHERLCAFAVEYGIETDYVRTLIRVRGFGAPQEAPSESWPWPVKVYTLGRFAVLLADQPLRFTGKSQKKPLQLLKALVALGSREVSEARLAEVLWPNSEGDSATQALATTLHRLRKLIGEHSLVRQEGRVSLNARRVWSDTVPFERCLGELERASQNNDTNRIRVLAERLFALYHGPFLRDDPDARWALPMRERLRLKFLRCLEAAARPLIEAGHAEQAVACYEKAIELEPLAEGLYRGLMQSHLATGDKAEAFATYQRCRRVLLSQLRISPSPATEALAREARTG